MLMGVKGPFQEKKPNMHGYAAAVSETIAEVIVHEMKHC